MLSLYRTNNSHFIIYCESLLVNYTERADSEIEEKVSPFINHSLLIRSPSVFQYYKEGYQSFFVYSLSTLF